MAIRPEMTPTLARMVNQQINSLPRPVKWFSLPRCCRAERPQKGRLREFYQWNVDIIGSDSILAEAECIFTAIDYLRSVGLTGEDVVARISSRALLGALLQEGGFTPEQLGGVYALLDKRPKVTKEAFMEMVREQIPDEASRGTLLRIQALQALDEVESLAVTPAARDALRELRELFAHLEIMGIADYCRFDITIVRGLAYYTGVVFEVYDQGDALRAVCAGGRYDNLLAGLGGSEVSGTGFGMGDVVLEILLREKNLLGQVEQKPDFFVIDADRDLWDQVLQVVCKLRTKGYAAVFDYKRSSVGKQLKQASAQKARFAVILGQETVSAGEVTVKNLESGEQKRLAMEMFMEQPDKLPAYAGPERRDLGAASDATFGR